MDFGGGRWAVERLVEHVETATSLGIEAVCANDHMVFASPWLDGPAALAAVVAASGRAYSCPQALEPKPEAKTAVPLWVASWGSVAGLRRAARFGDGWLASAYNTTPANFGRAWARLREELTGDGHGTDGFANGLATMWFHLEGPSTDDVLESRLAARIHRPADELVELHRFHDEVMTAWTRDT